MASIISQYIINHQHKHYLIDIDAMFLHVVPVIDLAPICKLHGQDPLCGKIPVDHGNLEREQSRM